MQAGAGYGAGMTAETSRRAPGDLTGRVAVITGAARGIGRAAELGRHGITVNAVIPGLIDTALTRHEDRYAQAIDGGGQDPTGDLSRDEETAKKLLTAKSPLGVPWIDPADVAPVVAFLASDEARMVSGASFAVTAGDSANITA
jgi:NAD(P)-dependent dehydrogenase (short-subunit alcohol dehydrogenase family)